jgi:hypothetical protein
VGVIQVVEPEALNSISSISREGEKEGEVGRGVGGERERENRVEGCNGFS